MLKIEELHKVLSTLSSHKEAYALISIDFCIETKCEILLYLFHQKSSGTCFLQGGRSRYGMHMYVTDVV